MQVMMNLISGVSAGIEFVQDEDLGNCIVVDLLILRVLFCWF